MWLFGVTDRDGKRAKEEEEEGIIVFSVAWPLLLRPPEAPPPPVAQRGVTKDTDGLLLHSPPSGVRTNLLLCSVAPIHCTRLLGL